ncbi:MAG: DMT family transporter [Bacillota bacterium]
MKKSVGILLIIISSVAYGFMPFVTKLTLNCGYNENTIIFVRCVISSLFLFIYIKNRKINYILNKRDLTSIIKVSVFGYGLMILFFIKSFQYIPTGISTAINFNYPIAVMLGSILFYNEKFDYKKLLITIASIVGIYLIVGIGQINKLNLTGFILTFVSGLLYAYYILSIGNGTLRQINSVVLTFYISLINIIPFFFASIISGNFSFEYSKIGLFYLLLISIITPAGMILFNIGLGSVSAVSTSIISTLELIITLIVGVLFLKEVLYWNHIIGSMLIMTSVIFIAWIEQNSSSATS